MVSGIRATRSSLPPVMQAAVASTTPAAAPGVTRAASIPNLSAMADPAASERLSTSMNAWFAAAIASRTGPVGRLPPRPVRSL